VRDHPPTRRAVPGAGKFAKPMQGAIAYDQAAVILQDDKATTK
jgi:hypothetical protein